MTTPAGCTVVALAGPPVATAEGLLTAIDCWLIMATAMALERACTFPVTPTTLELVGLELPVAIVHSIAS